MTTGAVASSHWYAGAVYSGSDVKGEAVGTVLKVPSTLPRSGKCKSDSTGDCYYVLLSVFDSTGSYDQIGLIANDGKWWVGYSYTTNKGGCPVNDSEYKSHLAAASATPGSVLSLSIGASFSYTDVNGSIYSYQWGVSFIAIDSTTSSVLVTEVVPNGPVTQGTYPPSQAEWLKVETGQSCKSGPAAGYTVYEEVYSAVDGIPNTNFTFTSNYYETYRASSGTPASFKSDPYNNNPSAVSVVIIKMGKVTDVYLDN